MSGAPTAGLLEDVTLLVARALEKIGVEYFLVGSVASSLQGEPRATNDIDFVVRMKESEVGAFAGALGTDFSADEEALSDAVRRGSSWNVYYLPLVTKVDLFFAAGRSFENSEFSRKRFVSLGTGSGLFVASPEDNILFKLVWFRKGGGASNSQWRDVVGMLRVSGVGLDGGYLDRWAEQLGVEEALARARAESAGCS